MHIAIMFWDWGIGGVQTRMTDVISHILKNKKTRVSLLLRNKIANERSLPKDSDQFEVTYCPAALRHRRWLFLIWLMYMIWKLEPTTLITILNRFHLIGIVAKTLLLFKKKKIKVILNQPVYTSYYLRQFESYYWRFIVRVTYPLSDIILVQTNAVREDLIKSFGIEAAKIVIAPNWIVSKQRKKSLVQYDMLFMGRLSPEKGVDVFLKIVLKLSKILPSLRAGIVGNGVLKDYVEDYIVSHKLSGVVEFAGYQNQPLAFLRKTRVLFLGSKNEGMPMTVLEAMSMGIPCIIGNFPGATELISHGENGFITTNIKQSADCILSLLENPILEKRIGCEAKKAVRLKYSKDNLEKFCSYLSSSI